MTHIRVVPSLLLGGALVLLLAGNERWNGRL